MLPYLQHESSLWRRYKTRLLQCDFSTGDFRLAINTLGRLFFVLSCWLAPTDAPSVQHGRRADRGATDTLARLHLSSGVGSKAAWIEPLVGLWCENTCHVVSSDPRFGQPTLKLGVQLIFGFSLSRSCSRLGCGSYPGPNTLPWADQGRAT
jgi:hypothetical protein